MQFAFRSAHVGCSELGCYKYFAATRLTEDLKASMSLQDQIESLAARVSEEFSDEDFALFNDFKQALNRGEVRAAERTAEGKWQTNAWVKRGILLGFRMGTIVESAP